ncbi:uncharacterized protein LOC144580836 [Callithrix jacchus]
MTAAEPPPDSLAPALGPGFPSPVHAWEPPEQPRAPRHAPRALPAWASPAPGFLLPIYGHVRHDGGGPVRFQTLQIEADLGSRERSQRAELGEPPPPSAAAASCRRRRTGPCPSLRNRGASTPASAQGEPGSPPVRSLVCPAPRM